MGLVVESDEPDLKVKFVNDVAMHYGDIVTDVLLGRVDSFEISSRLLPDNFCYNGNAQLIMCVTLCINQNITI